MNNPAQQFSTEVQAGESLLQALQRVSGLSNTTLIEAASKGAVWVSRNRGRGKTKPRRLYTLQPSDEGSEEGGEEVSEEVSEEGGEEVSEGGSEEANEETSKAPECTLMLNYDPNVLQQVPQTMHCVDEHANYGIWHKPAGMLCQGSKWSDHTVATQVASATSQRSCFLVHRLDKAASGLMLLAYTRNALKELGSLFQQRKVTKIYRAVVPGQFERSLPLLVDEPIDGKTARTTIQTANPIVLHAHSEPNCTELQVSIDTGRKHQIRRHLSTLGYPIVGDRLYSPASSVHSELIDLQLTATRLSFTCPFSQRKVDTSINTHND